MKDSPDSLIMELERNNEQIQMPQVHFWDVCEEYLRDHGQIDDALFEVIERETVYGRCPDGPFL
ncbi:MAG: hypothetical protein ACOCWQ_04745 [Nanoarchaeota archaeon]